MNPNPWKRWKECPQACREYWIATSLVIEGPRVPECCIGRKRKTCSGTSRGPHDSINATSTPRTRTLLFCRKTEQWSNSSTLWMPPYQSPWRYEVCQCIPMCILWMPAPIAKNRSCQIRVITECPILDRTDRGGYINANQGVSPKCPLPNSMPTSQSP
jgi:hypothetical protein